MFQDLVKNETSLIDIENIPYHYDNEITKLKNEDIQNQINKNNSLIKKISTTKINFGISEKIFANKCD